MRQLVEKHPKDFINHGLAKINIATGHVKLWRDKPDRASLWKATSFTAQSLAEVAQVEIPNKKYNTITQMIMQAKWPLR